MSDDSNCLHTTVSRALEIADAEERHPIAAMLADVLWMIDRDRDQLPCDDATGVTPVA